MTATRIGAPLVLSLLLVAGAAQAGVDAPGSVSFQWLADEDTVHRAYPPVPEDDPVFEADAFFSSDASSFGEEGVLVWAGFELSSPSGPRYGMLLLDLHLARAPVGGDLAMPHAAIRAEYIEAFNDEIYFEGQALVGDVWILDLLQHESDGGAVEGDFAMIFSGFDGEYPGSRVMIRGRFATRPSPTSLRRGARVDYGDDGDQVYVDTGCSGDVYIADDSDGCDCGGDDPEAGGCEGDTSSGGGCEGDSGGGCEGGDGGGCEGGGGGGCEGGGGGGCGGGGDACAVIRTGARRRTGGPLRTAMRLFPEIVVLLFLVGMKRKYRK